MSVSKKWVNDPVKVAEAIKAYRDREMLTMEQIAEKLATTHHNVSHVIRAHMPEAERKALAALRYSKSKEAEKNPMFGKRGEETHNWVGICEDGHGYLTCLHDGERQLIHRIEMSKAVGVKKLPTFMVVHHIDGNPKNNDMDNLALVTTAGHKTIHYLQAKDSKDLALRKSKLWEATRFMT